jgi:geranylgeranyl diphosphate synthase type II
VHGVATAELAAVALVARAFEVAACAPETPARTRASSSRSWPGQSAPKAAPDRPRTSRPTRRARPRRPRGDSLAQDRGSLRGGGRGGALSGGAGEEALEALTLFARNLGLAFQITDDMLDLSGDPERMGKDTQRDAHRANFATLFGLASSRKLVAELLESAVAALSPLGRKGAVLADLARVVRDRQK